MKTPHEQSFMPQDIHELKWAIVADKGYVGPPNNTPNERRVVPIRPARLHHEIDFNNRISQFRVPIEQFFGRVTKLWGIVRQTYRWEHSHFGDDFDICCLLTNHHIMVNRLCGVDSTFYLSYLKYRIENEEKKVEKRTAQQNLYATKRARRHSAADLHIPEA